LSGAKIDYFRDRPRIDAGLVRSFALCHSPGALDPVRLSLSVRPSVPGPGDGPQVRRRPFAYVRMRICVRLCAYVCACLHYALCGCKCAYYCYMQSPGLVHICPGRPLILILAAFRPKYDKSYIFSNSTQIRPISGPLSGCNFPPVRKSYLLKIFS